MSQAFRGAMLRSNFRESCSDGFIWDGELQFHVAILTAPFCIGAARYHVSRSLVSLLVMLNQDTQDDLLEHVQCTLLECHLAVLKQSTVIA